MKNTGNFLIDLHNIMHKHYELMLNIRNLSEEKQKIIYDNEIDSMLDKIADIYSEIANICIDNTFPKE